MKDQLPTKGIIRENANRITALHKKIHETWIHRGESREALDEWKRACAELRSQYDALAFPGGYEAGLRKIQAGDARAIEDALAFLEVWPYFFRSQYIRTKLKRLVKHAELSARQVERFQKVLDLEKQNKTRGKTHT